jgi:hypothetical protein
MSSYYNIYVQFNTILLPENFAESCVTLCELFAKVIQAPFSLSFPSFPEEDGIFGIASHSVSLNTQRPLLHEEFLGLSKVLKKLNWTCSIEEEETGYKVVFHKRQPVACIGCSSQFDYEDQQVYGLYCSFTCRLESIKTSPDEFVL